MKLAILAILAILVLQFGVSGQTKRAKIPLVKVNKTVEVIQADILSLRNASDFFVTYDKFDDLTTVLCKTDLTLSVYFQFKGKTLNGAVNNFTIRANSKSIKDKFSVSNKIQFIVDQERIAINNGDYLMSSGGAGEYLFFKVNKNTLQKIIDAKKVEYRVGAYEGYLTVSERDKIKILIALGTSY